MKNSIISLPLEGKVAAESPDEVVAASAALRISRNYTLIEKEYTSSVIAG